MEKDETPQWEAGAGPNPHQLWKDSCTETGEEQQGVRRGAGTSGGKDETGLGGEVETQTPGSHYHIGLKGTAHT